MNDSTKKFAHEALDKLFTAVEATGHDFDDFTLTLGELEPDGPSLNVEILTDTTGAPFVDRAYLVELAGEDEDEEITEFGLDDLLGLKRS